MCEMMKLEDCVEDCVSNCIDIALKLYTSRANGSAQIA